MKELFISNGWADEILREGNSMSVDVLWSNIKQTLKNLKNDFIPKCTTLGKPSWNQKNGVPVGKPLRDLIRRKQAFHRRWMSSKSADCKQASRLEYNKLRTAVKRVMRETKRSYERICVFQKESKSCLAVRAARDKGENRCCINS